MAPTQRRRRRLRLADRRQLDRGSGQGRLGATSSGTHDHRYDHRHNLAGASVRIRRSTGTTIGIGRLKATGVNFAAMLRALQGDSRTNILGTPSVVTRDNQEAKMEVAQEVPFLTGQYSTTNGTGSAFQTIQREEVGTILTVTPTINEGDTVLLKLQVESSSLAAHLRGRG